MNLLRSNTFFNNAVIFFKEKTLPILSDQNKKIVFIAAIIAFGALATYVVKHCFFSAIDKTKKIDEVKKEPLLEQPETNNLNQ